jgi:hypothetical protein
MFVEDIGKNDVLLGRGTGPNEFVGNIHFRALVREMIQSSPLPDKQGEKTKLAKKIVRAVKARKGRFLRKIEGSGREAFVVVPDRVAEDKTRQSFRHQLRSLGYAPHLKNQQGNKAAKSMRPPGALFKEDQQEMTLARDAATPRCSTGVSNNSEIRFCHGTSSRHAGLLEKLTMSPPLSASGVVGLGGETSSWNLGRTCHLEPDMLPMVTDPLFRLERRQAPGPRFLLDGMFGQIQGSRRFLCEPPGRAVNGLALETMFRRLPPLTSTSPSEEVLRLLEMRNPLDPLVLAHRQRAFEHLVCRPGGFVGPLNF